MFVMLSDFFLSEWIWSITWGMYHIPINLVVMFILSKLTLRVANIPLLMMIIGAHLFGIVLFSACVLGLLGFSLGINYLPTDSAYGQSYNVLNASLALGCIYGVLQSIFFRLLSYHYELPLGYLVIITLLSNMISAQLVYTIFPY